MDLAGGEFGQETGVFGHPRVVEAVRLPSRAPIYQRAPDWPRPCVARAAIQPRVADLNPVVQHVARAGNLRIRSEQCRHLHAQPIGRHPIVVVPVRDQFALARVAGDIAFGSQWRSAVEPYVAHAWIRRREILDTILTIVDDDQFLVRVVLPQEVRNRLSDQVSSIPGRHDATDQRRVAAHRLPRLVRWLWRNSAGTQATLHPSPPDAAS